MNTFGGEGTDGQGMLLSHSVARYADSPDSLPYCQHACDGQSHTGHQGRGVHGVPEPSRVIGLLVVTGRWDDSLCLPVVVVAGAGEGGSDIVTRTVMHWQDFIINSLSLFMRGLLIVVK